MCRTGSELLRGQLSCDFISEVGACFLSVATALRGPGSNQHVRNRAKVGFGGYHRAPTTESVIPGLEHNLGVTISSLSSFEQPLHSFEGILRNTEVELGARVSPFSGFFLVPPDSV